MTITLPLQPGEESKLIALAQAKGLSTDALVREALDKILADAPDQPKEPKLESRPSGIFFGPLPLTRVLHFRTIGWRGYTSSELR
jgi:hypothetical protein